MNINGKVASSEVLEALEIYYPNALKTDLFDTDYDLMPAEFLLKAYKGFWRWMKLSKFTGWKFNTMDCDKRSWLFRAFLISIHAKNKKARNSLPIIFMNYNINGQTGRGHSINALYLGDRYIAEIDPKPKEEGGGLVTLNSEERLSVSLRLC